METTQILIILAALIVGLILGTIGAFLAKKRKLTGNDQPSKNELLTLNHELDKKVQDIQNLNLKNEILQKEVDQQKIDFSIKLESLLKQKEEDLTLKEKSIREDAIKKSKSVMLGKMWEQIVPHYRPTDFTFIPSDARFLGSPVDFIVFKGASETDIEEVIFLEIKTAKSRLNGQQVKLKKLIDSLKSSKVRWETISIPIDVDKSEDIKE